MDRAGDGPDATRCPRRSGIRRGVRRGIGRAAIVAVTTFVGVAVIAGCAPGPVATVPGASPQPQSSSAPAVPELTDPTIVAEGLDAPWSVAFHDGVALVSERDTGRIVEVSAGGEVREVAEIAGIVAQGEGGLLGIAVHRGRLYAYSTGADGNRIERYRLTGEAGALALDEPEIVIDGIDAGATHNGGRIAFGPDGLLYATVGDAGDRPSAQDLESLNGKILRMTPDGDVPRDNPFAGSLVFSYGHRNPQGLAWDAEGTMYASEFGQDTWDELNVIEAGGNYGWPVVEGAQAQEGMIDPVQQWAPAEASPSGIAVAAETVFVAGLRGQRLLTSPTVDPAAGGPLLIEDFGRLRDVVVAPDGALWVVTNNTDGRGEASETDDRIIRFTLD